MLVALVVIYVLNVKGLLELLELFIVQKVVVKLASNNDPFTKARGKQATPYWLKKPNEKLMEKHRRLLDKSEAGARATRPRKSKPIPKADSPEGKALLAEIEKRMKPK